MVRTALGVAIAGLALGAAGCGSTSGSGTNPPGTISVTENDFKIELSAPSAPAGVITFDVDNKGPSIHEFVVFKTDLAPDALPTDSTGDVAESDTFAPVDELENIGLSDSPKLKINLEAGSYVLICNLPAHYRQGMHVPFTVT